MYNIHIIENQKENTVPVKLTIIKNGNKLLMVKAVKWFTGFGLRESKDIIELQEEDTFAKLSSDLCFIYTGIFKDKEGDFLYSNMIFNSEYHA